MTVDSSIASAIIENYTIYANGIVIDNNTNLMWMRCNLGQVWDGLTCTEKAGNYNWDSANKAVADMNKAGGFAGYTDWVLPDIEQLSTLRVCPRGVEDLQDIPTKDGGTKTVELMCSGAQFLFEHPTLNQTAFPQKSIALTSDLYWSATRDSLNDAWSANYSQGYFSTSDEKLEISVKPVRSVR